MSSRDFQIHLPYKSLACQQVFYAYWKSFDILFQTTLYEIYKDYQLLRTNTCDVSIHKQRNLAISVLLADNSPKITFEKEVQCDLC